MSDLTFGYIPQDIYVALPRAGTFCTDIVLDGGSYPAGDGVELRFYAANTTEPAQVWAATVTGATARFLEPPGQVAAVLDAHCTRARLFYTDADGTDILWGSGAVRAV